MNQTHIYIIYLYCKLICLFKHCFFLSNVLILLFAIFGDILYVEYWKSIREGFICISVNNKTNFSWPEMWKRMNTELSRDRKWFNNIISNTDSNNTVPFYQHVCESWLEWYLHSNMYPKFVWNYVVFYNNFDIWNGNVK